MIYEIKRGSTVIAAVRASGKQFKAVMSEDRVEMEFSLPSPVTFQIGDTVEVYGQTYKINRPSNIGRRFDKVGLTYQLEFEALYYDLGKWELKTLDKDNQLTESDVYMMTDAATMIDLIVRNANRVSSGWTVGAVEPTEVMQFGYSNTKLLTVLQDLADKYNLEFWVTGKQINFGRNQASSGLTWEYGKANELYELRRDRSDIPVINRLTVLGGTRNMPADYGYRRLQPSGGNPISVPPTGDIVEHTVIFENIYPHRVGVVSHVTADNVFRDTSLDFNITNYETNEPAKIAFISGQLAGLTFLTSGNWYNHANRQITIDLIEDDPGFPTPIPNSVRRPEVGDKYVLLDIYMPPSYVAAEEAKLQDIGEQYLEDYKVSHYNWAASLKPKYVLEDAVELVLGNTVRIVDTPLGIDTDIRISGFTRDLQEPYRYEVTLSNIITVSELVSQRNAQDRLAYTIQRSGLADGTSSETLQSVTRRGSVTDRAITVRGTRNTHLLGVPQAAPLPEDVVAGETYIWFGNPGGGSTPPPAYGNLEDLQNVANVIDDGKYLRKVGGQWVGVDISFPDLSGYATQSWVNAQGFIKAPDLSAYATQAWATGQFVTQATDQLSLPGNKGWTGRHHFTGSLSIPQAAPADPVAGQAYIWFGSPGSGGGSPSAGTLAGLDDVELASLANNQFLRYNSSTGKWVNSTFTVDLSGYATQSWVTAGFAPINHTHAISQVTGLQDALDGKEPAFTKNTAFNKNFGTTSGTVAQGNDSRIVNGQTAYEAMGNFWNIFNPPSYETISDFNDATRGRWDLVSGGINGPSTTGFHNVLTVNQYLNNNSDLLQINWPFRGNGRFSIRNKDNSDNWSDWITFWHDGNLDPTTFGALAGANTWTGHNHFTGALSIPQSAPTGAHAGQAYVWFGSPGSGGGGGASGTLAGLDDVALASLANNQLLRYNSSTGKWVNFTASYAPASHTHPISQITGLQAALDGKEPAFSKNTGFNKPFGTTANTVAQGNDSRVVNGQTAYEAMGNFWNIFNPPSYETISDFNDATRGRWDLVSGGINGPSTTGFHNVLTVNQYLNNNSDLLQINWPFRGNGRFSIRNKDNSDNWSDWITFWHDGNLANGTTSQYIRGDGSLATFPTIGNGTLSMSTGTGLSGSASFSANQTGNVSFTVSAASGYAIPTNTQITNWNNANNRYFSASWTGANNLTSHTQDWDNVTGAGAWVMSGASANPPISGSEANWAVINLYASANSSAQIALGVAGSGYTSGLYFRHRQGTTWRRVWDSTNLSPVSTSRQINTGNHLSGGGDLSDDRTLSVIFTTNNYVYDSQGNPRIYFSHNTTTTDMIFRLSQSNGRFAFRNANNSERLRIESNGKIYSYAGIESAGKITCPVIEPAAFIVPATAPSSPESGKRYLWVS